MIILLFILIIIICIVYCNIHVGSEDVNDFVKYLQFGAVVICNDNIVKNDKVKIFKNLNELNNYNPREYGDGYWNHNKQYPIYLNIIPNQTNKFSYVFKDNELFTPQPPTFSVDNYLPSVEISSLNPYVVTEKYDKFNVIMDNYLPGGTKQRALEHFLKNNNDKMLIYAGPSTGAAQLALGIIGKKLNKPVYMFASGKPNKMTKLAESHGVNVYTYKNLYEAQDAANLFAKQNGVVPFKFGFDDEYYNKCLIGALKSATKNLIEQPKRIWITCGSGTLLRALYHVFPNTYFIGIVVGKAIWWDQIDSSRTCMLVSPLKFTQNATIMPPYKSVPSYDAKLWEFAKKWGREGDYIWNVFGY